MGILDSEKAIVTGGAGGVGKGICERLIEEGAKLTIFDIDTDAGPKTADSLGASFIQVDVTDPVAVRDAVAQAVESMGGCTLFVNNAGGGVTQLVQPHKFTMDEFHNSLQLNFNSCFYCTHAIIPFMMQSGTGNIINISSGSGIAAPFGESVYGAAKAAMISFTRSLAIEYEGIIRANCISPGMVVTPLSEILVNVPGLLDPVYEERPHWQPGNIRDIGNIVVFLASEASSFINGQNIVADGGVILHHAGWHRTNLKVAEMIEQQSGGQ